MSVSTKQSAMTNIDVLLVSILLYLQAVCPPGCLDCQMCPPLPPLCPVCQNLDMKQMMTSTSVRVTFARKNTVRFRTVHFYHICRPLSKQRGRQKKNCRRISNLPPKSSKDFQPFQAGHSYRQTTEVQASKVRNCQSKLRTPSFSEFCEPFCEPLMQANECIKL